MCKVRPFDSRNALTSHALELLRETLLSPGNLMLSGGSTPYTLYNRLAAAPCPIHPNRKLFLSDERMVPADSPDNNAANLRPMLRALNCEDQFIRVNTQLPATEALSQFTAALHPLEPIDLGFLGLGHDGHTAGFFTKEHANLKNAPLALLTDRPDGLQGISVAPALFQRVKRMILLVTGESKRPIIKTLLNNPKTIPAGIALSEHPQVELWTDLEI